MRKHFNTAVEHAHNAHDRDPAVIAAMRSVYWMAKEDIATVKYASLLELQREQGCENLDKLSVANNATYTSRESADEFRESIAEEIHNGVLDKIRKSKMYTILIDESTDISISKQMVVYCRIVSEDFTPETLFLANLTRDDPKSTADVLFGRLEQYLMDNGLSLKSVVGFGSDGASVMTGKHNGVASKLKLANPHCINIHCMAHKFNLATSQA